MSFKLSALGSTLAFAALASTTAVPAHAQAPSPGAARPNIIFVLADDLGYGDIGVFFQNSRRTKNDRSQPWHQTPNLDAMAAQGIQIPQHYCSSPVCAPSRASLLLGVDQGHANVRDNQFDKALENNYTLANVLKQAGYATACIGKWGLQGNPSPTVPHRWPAHPQNRGFDSYFGYISHGAGHAHYPKEDGKKLFEDATDVVADYDKCYTTDLFTARAKKWIGDQHTAQPKQPFFLYLAYDTPHAQLQYPPSPYPSGGGLKGGVQWLGKPGQMINTASGTPDSFCYPDYANATWDDDHNPATPEVAWPDVYKRYASDVRRIDDCMGDLLQTLKDLKIDDNTLVIFTSDNGPSQESYLPEQNNPSFFHSFGPFDGIKRDLWEGGIRVGALARWPKVIPPGRTSATPSAFWDWLPTFAEAAGVLAPARTDGVSLLPTLSGKGNQKPSRLYFEYFMAGKTPNYSAFESDHTGRIRRQMQALRLGDYVGVRYNVASHAAPFEIYNVVTDPKETKNLGADPAFAGLQKRLHDEVLGLRRPSAAAPRPYDDEFVPAVMPVTTVPGLQVDAYETNSSWVAKVDGLKALASAQSQSVSWPKNQNFASSRAKEVVFRGYLEVPSDGDYTFTLKTNTRALLRLHEAIVLDDDFGQRPGTKAEGTIRLKAGKHPFLLYSLKADKSLPTLDLKWKVGEAASSAIPKTAWSH